MQRPLPAPGEKLSLSRASCRPLSRHWLTNQQQTEDIPGNANGVRLDSPKQHVCLCWRFKWWVSYFFFLFFLFFPWCPIFSWTSKDKLETRLVVTWDKDNKRLRYLAINLPREDFSSEQGCDGYRLRWQIELIFREWKSYANLHAFDTEQFQSGRRVKTLILHSPLWQAIGECLQSDILHANDTPSPAPLTIRYNQRTQYTFYYLGK